MNITVAKTAGFCFGVDRAVQIVDGLLDRQQRVCTLGPIIHNPQTLSRLAQRLSLIHICLGPYSRFIVTLRGVGYRFEP